MRSITAITLFFLSAAVGKRAISAFKSSRKFIAVPPISVRLGGGQSLYVNLSQGKLVRSITLFLCAALAVTSVNAASYQQIGGTIVDPILDVDGNVLFYSGNNLEPSAQLQNANLPYANLSNADLHYANLMYANLSDATLTSANLSQTNLDSTNMGYTDLTSAALYRADLGDAVLKFANLSNADLSESILIGANLRNADLKYADLFDADLSAANLSGAIFTNTQKYTDATWSDAFYWTDKEPFWDSGMDQAWRDSVGIVERSSPYHGSPVPEPAAILLALLGLALLPRRRRR